LNIPSFAPHAHAHVHKRNTYMHAHTHTCARTHLQHVHAHAQHAHAHTLNTHTHNMHTHTRTHARVVGVQDAAQTLFLPYLRVSQMSKAKDNRKDKGKREPATAVAMAIAGTM
jgi:hypothetical protein